ncbi:Transmembrane protein 256, partial [Ananas comosus]
MDGPVDSLRDPLTLTPHCPRSDSIEPSTTTTTKRPLMDPMLWHKVAAVSGVAALGLGTYGAHVFRPKNASYKEVWQTASLYHLVHTAALVGAPFTKRPHIVRILLFFFCYSHIDFMLFLYSYFPQFGGLLTAGILAFSG